MKINLCNCQQLVMPNWWHSLMVGASLLCPVTWKITSSVAQVMATWWALSRVEIWISQRFFNQRANSKQFTVLLPERLRARCAFGGHLQSQLINFDAKVPLFHKLISSYYYRRLWFSCEWKLNISEVKSNVLMMLRQFYVCSEGGETLCGFVVLI